MNLYQIKFHPLNTQQDSEKYVCKTVISLTPSDGDTSGDIQSYVSYVFIMYAA